MNNDEKKKLTPRDDVDFSDKEELVLETSINRGIWIETIFNILVILFFTNLVTAIIVYYWPSNTVANIYANIVATFGFFAAGIFFYGLNEWLSNNYVQALHKNQDEDVIHNAIGNHRMEYLSEVGSRPNSANFLPFSYFSKSTQYAQEIVRENRRKKKPINITLRR